MQIDSIKDLAGKKVGVVAGSQAKRYLKMFGGDNSFSIVEYPVYDDALEGLFSKKVHVKVYSDLLLIHLRTQNYS